MSIITLAIPAIKLIYLEENREPGKSDPHTGRLFVLRKHHSRRTFVAPVEYFFAEIPDESKEKLGPSFRAAFQHFPSCKYSFFADSPARACQNSCSTVQLSSMSQKLDSGEVTSKFLELQRNESNYLVGMSQAF